ncbi:MAG: glycoside hydrolase family 9 protein [Flammeovirgaceae bacterium]|nr:glycoside hydrolase family 9 protein [Flammeovirgaceae bacterium]
MKMSRLYPLRYLFFSFLCFFYFQVSSQSLSEFIIVDHFGYLPEANKVAVIKDPQIGFDAVQSFSPSQQYAVVNVQSGVQVFTGELKNWNSGATDNSSGDKVWWFDFSSVMTTGDYYVMDIENNLKSFEFKISPSVYNEVLKQAVRTFFYQRVGYEKEAKYAGIAWADGVSHNGNLQDKNCRIFDDKNNVATEKDLSGGWYDAGDYNKYTNWTANYVVEMMKAYLENPNAWRDDYNIPESGNGIPDLIDEAKWGIDHLLRMQQADGAVLSIVGEAHASPPSSANAPSYYGPASTSATLNTASAFAIASKVFQSIGMTEYADQLRAGAITAWNWAKANPAMFFKNNDDSYNSKGLGAGQQEESDYQRSMSKLEAACFLFELTKEVEYRTYFDSNYKSAHLFEWTYVYPYEVANQEVFLYYTQIPGATQTIVSDIKSVYLSSIEGNDDNLPAYQNATDPYNAFLKEYTWGSNAIKSAKGNMYYDVIQYDLPSNNIEDLEQAALGYLNYLHGVNPLNMTYLSNMYNYGGDKSVNEFYHSWFTNGSSLWDRVGESIYGPPPGFLTGGPNSSYDWDGCCPDGCGSAENNAICSAESIAPPKGQPAQKSYKDFNTSWPLNSWSVTENSCGYQVNYIRLLSKFVNANYNCSGEENGSAAIDVCGQCAGGNTGIPPITNQDDCVVTGTEEALLLNDIDIHIFPNPTGEFLFITSREKKTLNIRIIDTIGKSFLESEAFGNTTLDVGALPAGIYVVIIDYNDQLFKKKFIKN